MLTTSGGPGNVGSSGAHGPQPHPAYWESVIAYEAAVDRRNAAAAREHQARLNRREVATVRPAACPSCFATHPGEC